MLRVCVLGLLTVAVPLSIHTYPPAVPMLVPQSDAPAPCSPGESRARATVQARYFLGGLPNRVRRPGSEERFFGLPGFYQAIKPSQIGSVSIATNV